MQHHTVVQHRDISRLQQCSVLGELRSLEQDVVGLPLARLATRVHHRRTLLVDRTALSIEVRLVLIGIEDLHLVASHQINAAIAASLSLANDLRRHRELQMQLAITERLLGRYTTATHHGVTILHLPVAAFESREISPIKQHDGIRGSSVRIARIYHRRLRPHNPAQVLIHVLRSESHGDRRARREQHRYQSTTKRTGATHRRISSKNSTPKAISPATPSSPDDAATQFITRQRTASIRSSATSDQRRVSSSTRITFTAWPSTRFSSVQHR